MHRVSSEPIGDEESKKPGVSQKASMTGGPPQFFRITAEQCAREALTGFDRGAALVFPGRPYRLMMRIVLPLIPRGVLRRQAAKTALRLRITI